MKKEASIIGIDLGGTKILAAKIVGVKIIKQHKKWVPNRGDESEVLQVLFELIDQIIDEECVGIGVGVPSIVDIKEGIVYEVQNIPSWKKVQLKSILENRYGVPVYINNDANCFAAGEKHFGKGRAYQNFVGLVVGTGVAAGLIIHNKLYNGSNTGAGEFGMIPYLDQYFEYYASGQFFNNVYGMDGPDVFQKAQSGDPQALAIFDEFGTHLGHTIKAILYAVDPEVIIMGGSISRAYPFFKSAVWRTIKTLAYSPVVDNLKIEISDNPDIAVLGAAALFYDTF